MKTKAVQAANGTLSDEDRAAINNEISALAEEIAAPPASEAPKGKRPGKKRSASEEEILKDALDVFGGIVIK